MEGPFGEHREVWTQNWPKDEVEDAHEHIQENFSEHRIHSSHPFVWEDAQD